MSKTDYRKKTFAIAKGEYKPGKNEPNVWFKSMESLGQVLQQLPILTRDRHPASPVELEALSGRKKSNLPRTLKTLSNYGMALFNSSM